MTNLEGSELFLIQFELKIGNKPQEKEEQHCKLAMNFKVGGQMFKGSEFKSPLWLYKDKC